jgi:cytochrome c peroxidase
MMSEIAGAITDEVNGLCYVSDDILLKSSEESATYDTTHMRNTQATLMPFFHVGKFLGLVTLVLPSQSTT